MRRLHHVQVSCPPGGEGAARGFWVDGLGLEEVPKPAGLAGRGGAWFRSPDGAEVHVGVEDPFVPARRAHPALLVGVGELDPLAERLVGLGHEVNPAERHAFAGFLRFHCADPFGNRVEVLEELRDPRG